MPFLTRAQKDAYHAWMQFVDRQCYGDRRKGRDWLCVRCHLSSDFDWAALSDAVCREIVFECNAC